MNAGAGALAAIVALGASMQILLCLPAFRDACLAAVRVGSLALVTASTCRTARLSLLTSIKVGVPPSRSLGILTAAPCVWRGHAQMKGAGELGISHEQYRHRRSGHRGHALGRCRLDLRVLYRRRNDSWRPLADRLANAKD